jgi:hypothetical protein
MQLPTDPRRAGAHLLVLAVLLLLSLVALAFASRVPSIRAAAPASSLLAELGVKNADGSRAWAGLVDVAQSSTFSHTLFLPLVVARPAVLMEDHFDAGIDAWTPFLNHHRLEPGQWFYSSDEGYGGSGGLNHSCCTGTKVAGDALMMYLQPGAQDWTDYRVEAKVLLRGGVTKDGDDEPNSGDPVGFWIRGHWQESALESQWTSGYYVVIVGKSDDPEHYVRISKIQQPGDCEACLKDYRMYNFDNPMEKAWSAPLPGPFEHYRWYTLAVEVRGASFKVYLDDELALEWTDPLLPYMSGTIGFKVHETKSVTFDDVRVVPLY